MEMLHVLFIDVGRGDIRASSKPPDTAISFEVAVIKVHSGAEGVLWVHDTGQTTGKERDTFSRCHALGTIDTPLGGSLECFLRHATIHNRQIDSGLFKDFASCQNPRHASPTIFTRPAVFLEFGFAINFLNGFGNADLRVTNHFFEFGSHRKVSVGASVGVANQGAGCLVDRFVCVPSQIDRWCVRSSLFALLSGCSMSVFFLFCGGEKSGVGRTSTGCQCGKGIGRRQNAEEKHQ
mmetsp:Transcript_24633/g.68163  ORF Transcript_24633/g.68163 Transcript_24633/m.68163 type:complete len:236 (+) Transcript_24633:707-1414(+)